MYFLRNWEFGSAFSKLRNFSVHHCVFGSFFFVTQFHQTGTATIRAPSGPFEQEGKFCESACSDVLEGFQSKLSASRYFVMKPVIVVWICALHRQAIHVGTC